MSTNFPGNFDDLKLHNEGIFYRSDGSIKKMCNTNSHPNINWVSY